MVREAVFDPRYLGKCESIFCLGNGYLNVRSALEERYVGETRDLLVTGTFNRAEATEVTELPNLPDITNVDILLDGKRFRMDAGTLQEYRRELDLQTGELSRHVVWASPEGNRVTVSYTHLDVYKRQEFFQASCIGDLGRAIEQEEPVGLPPEQARHVIEIMCRVEESARDGETKELKTAF